MDLFKLTLLIVRLFGAVWFVIGIVWLVAIVAGFFLLPHAEEIYGALAQYFVYGILEVASGLTLIALGQPIAKFVAARL